MMRLVVVRHGHAGVASQDRDRELTPAGRAAVERLGQSLAASGWRPDLVLSSPAARALATAAALGAEVRVVRDLYLGGVHDALAAMGHVEPEAGTVAMVGHNPVWEHLVHALSGALVPMAPGTAVLLEFGGGAWQRAGIWSDGDRYEGPSLS